MKCLVLIPGIMGSALADNEGRVWPPTAGEVLFGYGKIDRLMGDQVKPTEIIRRVSVVAVYESLLNDIRRCGYTEGHDRKRFIPFPYDWRRSCSLAADSLASLLDSEFDDDTDFAELDITLVAHSMGGLVCRYLLESERFTNKGWFSSIGKLVTLGTPHRGAPAAIQHLSGEKGKLGLSGKDVRKLADDARFTALYELAGHENNGFATIKERRGELPTVIDPLGTEVVELLGLNAANAQSAREFWGHLDPSKRPPSVGYFCVAGSAFKTVVRSEIRALSDPPVSIDRKSSGDETVPFMSAAIPGFAQNFSRKKHSTIFEDRDVRKVLYRIFDAPADVRPQSADDVVDLGADEAVGIGVNSEVYAIGESIEVSVAYNKEMIDPHESFEIIRFDETSGTRIEEVDPVAIKTSFLGSGITSFSFSISNPFEPGLYELRPLRDVDDPSPTFFFITDGAG